MTKQFLLWRVRWSLNGVFSRHTHPWLLMCGVSGYEGCPRWCSILMKQSNWKVGCKEKEKEVRFSLFAMQHDWIFSKCQYKPNIFGGSREILVWVLHPHTVLEIYTAKKQRLNDGDRDYRINPRAGTTRLKMTLRFAPFLLPGRRFLMWIQIICFLSAFRGILVAY